MVSNCSRSSKRPAQYNVVIGITSLWLLIPVSHGIAIVNAGESGSRLASTILTSWTLLSACVSTAMWKTCSKGSLLHNLDLACAKVEFVMLLVYFARFGGLNIWMQCFFPSFVVIMYTITNHFHEGHRWLLNTWAHLIFRYIGYWWCHIALIREKKLWISFLFLSFGYYTHIILKMKRLSSQKKFDIDIEYISGILEMLVIIGAFGAMHWMQIQYL